MSRIAPRFVWSDVDTPCAKVDCGLGVVGPDLEPGESCVQPEGSARQPGEIQITVQVRRARFHHGLAEELRCLSVVSGVDAFPMPLVVYLPLLVYPLST
jgi:hypothetical protein